jgi:hypothetical protein
MWLRVGLGRNCITRSRGYGNRILLDDLTWPVLTLDEHQGHAL